ncbi:MAG: thioredoxin family protein [Myxococcales bacterium]|nr:thioredoxin family protein [Myxococcales bacterium]
MPRIIRKLSLVSLFLVGLSGFISPAVAQQYPFVEGSFDDVLKIAQTRNQRILVDVYTVWCGPCKRLISEVFGSQEMHSISDQFVAWRIDAETPEGMVFAKQYNVQRYPTSLFLTKDGTEETRIVGFRELPGYMAEVRRWLAGQATPAATQPSAVASKPTNPEDGFILAYRSAFAGKPNVEAELRAIMAQDLNNERQIRAWAMLAIAEWVELRHGNNPNAAEKTLREILRAYPESQQAIYAVPILAEALAMQGKTKEGQKLLEKQLQQRPGDGRLVGALLVFCASTEDVDIKRCTKTSQNALKSHSESAPLWEALATVQQKAGQIDAAKASLERAVTLRPGNVWYSQRLEQLVGPPANDRLF